MVSTYGRSPNHNYFLRPRLRGESIIVSTGPWTPDGEDFPLPLRPRAQGPRTIFGTSPKCELTWSNYRNPMGSGVPSAFEYQ